ncbi:SDR family oxidoreductase [Streptomyces sp. AK02-01A]|uniref:SDR family oxidoreductase n=1 Tax=Streptomyces sp. AK02-01A TaxID=3028648 RepID=UPI0029BBD0B3|nr:SDR family oxidoreductase [Streptomyces sp. AK02-01A]MDX3850197.1 SDR family oxidoreductase [Streptomyces sp. AK02-01A]
MEVKGATALVTGANRGLGREFARALSAAGANVYGAARDAAAISDDGVTAVELDVTSDASVTAAAKSCPEVSILINNAGIARPRNVLQASIDDARQEIEVNYLGSLRVAQAFAPVLRRNGGGAMVNILSAVSWVAMPRIPTYSASKAAQWAISNALRSSLRGQGTLVTGIHLGFADTDLAAAVELEKIPPAAVARAVLAGLEEDREEVVVDDFSRMVKSKLCRDPAALYPQIERDFG